MNTSTEHIELKNDITKFLTDIKNSELGSRVKINIEITKTRRGLTHCIVGLENNHNKIFKRNEKRLLKKHLNITEIKYKHAYIKSAKFANGQEAW